MANGKIQPVLQVKISAEVSGEIIDLPVKEGQKVNKGDLLVKIKPEFYIAALNQADASYKVRAWRARPWPRPLCGRLKPSLNVTRTCSGTSSCRIPRSTKCRRPMMWPRRNSKARRTRWMSPRRRWKAAVDSAKIPCGSAHAQYYSLGKSEDWAPSASGEGFIAQSGKTSINATTNLGMFLKSLVENGFPTDLLATGNLKCLIGTKCHVLMKQTDRKSLVRAGRDTSKPTGVLLVSKINSLPGADTKGAVAGKGKAAAPATKAAVSGKANGAATTAKGSVNDDIDATLIEKLTEALAENDPLPKKTLLQIASGAFKGTPSHSAAIKRSAEADFLKSLEENGISFDGAQFSLA